MGLGTLLSQKLKMVPGALLLLPFKFAWRHKVLSLLIVLAIVPTAFLLQVLTGPFGFLAKNVLQLSGLLGAKNYLVLLQNENELRPTGGFLTSFATLKVGLGGVDLQFFPSELVQIPSPEVQAPKEIERVFSSDEKFRGWVFRDSNFALSFPQNAKKAQWFLQKDDRFFGTQFDGVLAADFHAVESLVQLFGPFQIEGQEFSGENLFATLQKNAKDLDLHDRHSWQNRKSIFAPLAASLLGKMFKSPKKWPQLLATLATLANEKHLLLNFAKKELQESVVANGWAGALPERNFFAVNFANLGGRKVDRYLQKDFFSTFTANAAGELVENFQMRLAHHGTFSLQSDRFETFVRIMRPPGTRLLWQDGDFATRVENESRQNFEEFSHFAVLMPGEVKTFTFAFAFPFTVENESKIPLHFFKQPGTFQDHFSLAFRGFGDESVLAENCETFKKTENVSRCEFALRTDRTIFLEKQPDTTPPILQFARFANSQQIEMRFSEPVAVGQAIEVEEVENASGNRHPDLAKFQITDLNETNLRSAKLEIQRVTFQENSIFLFFTGSIENQKGEFFKLAVQDLQDWAGNKKGENPFVTTIVQDF